MSKLKCVICNDVIESKHRHDYQKCKCGECYIDGGNDYFRCGAGDLNNIKIFNEETNRWVKLKLEKESKFKKIIGFILGIFSEKY